MEYLTNDKPPTRFEHPMNLLQCLLLIRDATKSPYKIDGVEVIGWVRESLCIATDCLESCIRTKAFTRVLADLLEGFVLPIDDRECP